MLTFSYKNKKLILTYDSDRSDNSWVYNKLTNNEGVSFKQTFHLGQGDLLDPNYTNFQPPDMHEPVEFVIGEEVEKGYYRIDGDILGIEYHLYIHKSIKLTYKSFTAERNVSIFSVIDDLAPDESLYVGGEQPYNIPEKEFSKIIKTFPNTYELRKYVFARVSSIVRDYIETKIDGEEKYHQYMNKKSPIKKGEITDQFRESEIFKYTSLQEKLEMMLKNESKYQENQWQEEILQILLLLYPKYIHIIKEARVKDTYGDSWRKLDFMLVDSTGNIDIVEIKQPFDKCIVTKNQYRKNYIPLRELSGTVMQVEKYIFYLNKWGIKGEEYLTKKYASSLPEGFKIKVTNPRAIIIMGRENNLSEEQLNDFEVIKRKYKNVLDIISYDDLINRVKIIVEQLKKHI